MTGREERTLANSLIGSLAARGQRFAEAVHEACNERFTLLEPGVLLSVVRSGRLVAEAAGEPRLLVQVLRQTGERLAVGLAVHGVQEPQVRHVRLPVLQVGLRPRRHHLRDEPRRKVPRVSVFAVVPPRTGPEVDKTH